jgi:hypothetical protein
MRLILSVNPFSSPNFFAAPAAGHPPDPAGEIPYAA